MSNPEEGFVEMYKAHSHQIYAYCRRRASAEAANDAVSETFLVAWRRYSSIPSREEQLPWLYGVAYRVLSQQRRTFRRKQRLREKLKNTGVSAMEPPDYVIVLREEAEMARQAADRLDPIDAEALRFAIWEELSHTEIATVLGITKGAVKQRLYRARQSLTKEFNRLEQRQHPSPTAQKGGAW